MILRVPVIVGILVGFFLLPLIPQFEIPYLLFLKILSILLMALGFIIMIISSVILIKNDHFIKPAEMQIDPVPQELVRKSIYKYIRHPIYTGVILAYIGYCLFIGGIPSIIILIPLMILILYFKARQEEKDLKEIYEYDYVNYQKSAGLFLPKVRKR